MGDLNSKGFYRFYPFIKFHHLRSFCCLKGHYHLDGYYLWQAHPDIFTDKEKYWIISYIRDTLQTHISKYYYNLKNKLISPDTISLREYLLGQFEISRFYKKNFDNRLIDSTLLTTNHLSVMLGCNSSNYKSQINKYFFIGILEDAQNSLDIFSKLINEQRVILPHINKTERTEAEIKLTKADIKEFKERNKLDYKIYNYCKNKLDLHTFKD